MLSSAALRLASLQFIPAAPIRSRHRGCVTTVLLFMGILTVPVCVNALIVPDGGCLGVTAIAWFSCVVGGVEEERFHREG